MTRKPRFTPLRENGDKWTYTTGLFNEGGSAVKWKPAKRRPTPRIAIGMCSKDALDPAAHVWNVSISAGQKAVCPRTPENPEGRAYFIFKTGEGREKQ